MKIWKAKRGEDALTRDFEEKGKTFLTTAVNREPREAFTRLAFARHSQTKGRCNSPAQWLLDGRLCLET